MTKYKVTLIETTICETEAPNETEALEFTDFEYSGKTQPKANA